MKSTMVMVAGLLAACGSGGAKTTIDGAGDPIDAAIDAPKFTCGNGLLEAGEVCDDGNLTDGDGCDHTCQHAACFVPVTHPTIAAALADTACPRIEVYSGTYQENLSISRDVTLVGVGATTVTIDGQQRNSVIAIASGSVTLSALTIMHGQAISGGGILNHGTLVADHLAIANNAAIGEFAQGGGIFSDGALTLAQSTVHANTATSTGSTNVPPGAAGAGIFVTGGLMLSDSTIDSNTMTMTTAIPDVNAHGAGIAVGAGASVIESTMITGNTIAVDGGTGNANALGAGVFYDSGLPGAVLGTVSITGNTITVAGGTSTIGAGGGVYVSDGALSAAMTASKATVMANSVHVTGGAAVARGGGLYLAGTSTAASLVVPLVVSMNDVVATAGAPATTAPRAYGGGVAIENVAASLSASSITMNTATATGNPGTASGGGVYWTSDTRPFTFSLASSTVASNTVTARTALGGGLYVRAPSGVHVATLATTTISNNVAHGVAGGTLGAANGGGVAVQGTITVNATNSTIAQNQANGNLAGFGGGVAFVEDTTGQTIAATFASCTIAENTTSSDAAIGTDSGGGLGLNASMNGTISVKLHDTILLLGTSTASPDCAVNTGSTVASVGYSMHRTAALAGCSIAGNGDATLLATDDPKLGTLADHGGPTLTYAPMTGSFAIDSGDPTNGCTDALGNALATDQRGSARTVGARCDIGAVEVP